MPKPIRGVLPIVHTPFTDADEIDRAGLQREIDGGVAVNAGRVPVAHLVRPL